MFCQRGADTFDRRQKVKTYCRRMNYKKLVRHFGGQSKAGRALGTDRRVVHDWKNRRRIPSRWQIKAAGISNGKLKLDVKAKRDASELSEYLKAA